MGFCIFSLIAQIVLFSVNAFLLLFSLEGTLQRFIETCLNVSVYGTLAPFFIIPVVLYFSKYDNEENSPT